MGILTEKPPFRLHSPAFAYGERIPKVYTCEGQDVNPPLSIEHVPEDAEALVLSMEDPDAPGGTWTHWRLWNISPQTTLVKEQSVPSGAVVGKNSFGQFGYGGPCPPAGEHTYIFRVYALRTPLHIPAEATDLMFRNALLGNVIAEADLVGYYQKNTPLS